MIYAMKRCVLESRLHAPASSVALLILELFLLFIIIQHIFANDVSNEIIGRINSEKCSDEFEITNYNQKFSVIVERVSCYKQCQTGCPEKPWISRSCQLRILSLDPIINKYFQICIDGKGLETSSCSSIAWFRSGPLENRYKMLCTTRPGSLLSSITKCFSPKEFTVVSIGNAYYCSLEGHLDVFLRRGYYYETNFYILTSIKECGGLAREVDARRGTIISSHSLISSDPDSFCNLTVRPQLSSMAQICVTFHIADFPPNGAKLTIVSGNSHHKWEFDHTNKPPLDNSICTKELGSDPKIQVFITTDDSNNVSGNHHAFGLEFEFHTYRDVFLSGGFDEDDDYQGSEDSKDNESSFTEFRKKIILSVAVFCVALFICCCYAYSKSKDANTNHNNDADSDPGLGEQFVRTPYYEHDRTRTNEESVPINIQPNQTPANDPPTSVQRPQPPPDYGLVTASSPSAPHSGHSPASAPPWSEVDRSAEPPAYDSLFPDRKDK